MRARPVIKEKDRFADHSLGYRLRRAASYLRMAGANARFGARCAARRVEPFDACAPHALDERFFGVNCPPSRDPALEDCMFDAVRDLGVRAARMDWGYDTDAEIALRWILRLRAAGIEPLVRLVQPHAAAARMHEASARGRWRDFMRSVVERCGDAVRVYEPGATPNRHSWSGYTIGGYVEAAAIAHEIAGQSGVEIVGPNVSDFAPYFTIALLDGCRKRGVRFAAMTDNLFCDRAGAPETYDRSVAGERLRDRVKMDLVGKSRALAAIARDFGIPRAYCTYCYYTLNLTGKQRASRKRPERYVPPGTYADYLVRYFTLSAAAGALDRVYWGNLAGHFKGVIDDGYPHRPDPPTVHHKFENYGEVGNYTRREAFAAFQNVVARLSGARFVRAISARDPFIFEFERAGAPIVVAWSREKDGEPAPQLEDFLAKSPTILDRNGRETRLHGPPRLTGSPLFIE